MFGRERHIGRQRISIIPAHPGDSRLRSFVPRRTSASGLCPASDDDALQTWITNGGRVGTRKAREKGGKTRKKGSTDNTPQTRSSRIPSSDLISVLSVSLPCLPCSNDPNPGEKYGLVSASRTGLQTCPWGFYISKLELSPKHRKHAQSVRGPAQKSWTRTLIPEG